MKTHSVFHCFLYKHTYKHIEAEIHKYRQTDRQTDRQWYGYGKLICGIYKDTLQKSQNIFNKIGKN